MFYHLLFNSSKYVFVEVFFETNPFTKSKFIKGKGSIKDLAFSSNEQSLEWPQVKFLLLERYLETVFEKASNDFPKTPEEHIINFINDFIEQFY